MCGIAALTVTNTPVSVTSTSSRHWPDVDLPGGHGLRDDRRVGAHDVQPAAEFRDALVEHGPDRVEVADVRAAGDDPPVERLHLLDEVRARSASLASG